MLKLSKLIRRLEEEMCNLCCANPKKWIIIKEGCTIGQGKNVLEALRNAFDPPIKINFK